MTAHNLIKSEDLIIALPNEKYDSFCKKLHSKITKHNLEIFQKNEFCSFSKNICKEIFFEEISTIEMLVKNPHIGIAGLDIPETNILDRSIDSIAGTAAALGIFNNIGTSTVDPLNSTPFTLHSASHTNAKLLSSTEHTPEAKLGFHNDGLIKEGTLELPKHIMLYNLYLGYREPGNFRWIPTALWDDMEYFTKKINTGTISIKMKPTPHFNLHKDLGFQKTTLNDMEIPISHVTQDGEIRFFLNGKIIADKNEPENIKIIEMIRSSLEKNPINFCIPQKERRAIFLNNTHGFHARDIFKEPIDGIDLTRVFLRSIDSNTEPYPSSSFMLR